MNCLDGSLPSPPPPLPPPSPPPSPPASPAPSPPHSPALLPPSSLFHLKIMGYLLRWSADERARPGINCIGRFAAACPMSAEDPPWEPPHCEGGGQQGRGEAEASMPQATQVTCPALTAQSPSGSSAQEAVTSDI